MIMFAPTLKRIVLVVGTLIAIVSGAVVLAQSGQPCKGSAREVPPEVKSIGSRQRVPLSGEPVAGKPAPLLHEGGPTADEPTAQDDRIRVLEETLDQVLRALERLSEIEPPTELSMASARTPSADMSSTGTGNEPPTGIVREATLYFGGDSLSSTDNGPPAGIARVEPPMRSFRVLIPSRAGAGDAARELDGAWGRMAMGGGMDGMGPSVSDRLDALERQMHQVLHRLDRLEGQWKSLDRRVGRGSGETYPEPLR